MTDRSPRTRPDRREPVRNLSRRGFLGAASGALVLGVGLRLAPAAAQTRAEGPAAVAPKPGTRVAAFLEIRPDDSVRLLSPFVEGARASTPASPRRSARSSTSTRRASRWNAPRPAPITRSSTACA